MEVEEKRMLNEALELSRENHRMLTKLYRSMLWGRVYRVIYWIIAIGITIGSFYFLQPYIEQLQRTYQDIQRGFGKTQTTSNSLQNFFSQFGSGK